MDRLELIEREAHRLMDYRVATLDLLKTRAHTLATFLFTAASAAVAFALALYEKEMPRTIVIGVAVLGAAWYVVGAIVVWRCIAPTMLPPVGHEPKSLMDAPQNVEVDEIRRGCLREIQNNQAAFSRRSGDVGKWLTRSYYYAMLIPPVVAVAVGFLVGLA
jgi:hypothetical protein